MKKWQVFRWITLGVLFAIVVGGAAARNLSGNISVFFPEIEGLCPLGGVQTLGRIIGYALQGAWSKIMAMGPRLYLLAGVAVTAAAAGALFCGWFCPFGAWQELFGGIGKKIFKKRYNKLSGTRVDRYLGYVRYLFLGTMVLGTALFGLRSFDLVNPSFALFHFLTAAVPISALALLAVISAASLFVERPWCRWVCPYGGLQGVFTKVSPVTIIRNEKKCISCGKCNTVCPFGINIVKTSFVADSRCNRCFLCVSACPVKGALLPGKRKKVEKYKQLEA